MLRGRSAEERLTVVEVVVELDLVPMFEHWFGNVTLFAILLLRTKLRA